MCHRPSKPIPWWLWAMVLAVPVLPIVYAIWLEHFFVPHQKREIHVKGQVCEVVFVKTGRSCTSTGACHDYGYDEAVCP